MKRGNVGGLLKTVILLLVLIGGLALMLFLVLPRYLNARTQDQALVRYAEKVAAMEPADYEETLEKALDYNARLYTTDLNWAMTDAQRNEYVQILNVDGAGCMGVIEIPALNAELPIFHGGVEAAEESYVTHVEGTSLPGGVRYAGAAGSVRAPEYAARCVLSDHRSLRSTRLFHNLDKLGVGERFMIRLLDETFTYEVDDVTVIEPDMLGALTIVPGRDEVILMTDTPRGTGMHLLLVTGRRVENETRVADRVPGDGVRLSRDMVLPFVAAAAFIVLIIWLLAAFGGAGKRRGD